MNWGKRIIDIRSDKGHKQTDLAKLLNVGQTTVSAWERSAYPPLDAIDKICNLYNIRLWEFFLLDNKELNNYMRQRRQFPNCHKCRN
jgi:transcriptional regulator with XRE-family HTH domain